LYEQGLQAAALEVAQKYKTDTNAWVQAALSLRSPYWDWADPATYLPPRQVYDSTRYANLHITTPDGPKDVPNPLLAYTFQRKINWSFSQYPATVRHPRSPPNPAASIAAFEADVGSQATNGNLQWDCWRTLNWTTTWSQFSNQGATQGQKANSLETLHNWMHNRTGGNGHMSNPIAASYDPIFMLHHTNVDRQLALWQTLHPEVWISQQNEPQFVNLDLTPFWKSANAFHRSTDTPVRDFVKFQSTYPEFVGTENLSVAERKAAIQQKVDALYDPNNRRRGIAVNPAVGRVAAIASGIAGSVTKGAPLLHAAAAVAPGGAQPQAAFSALSVQAPLPVAPSPHGDAPGTLTALQRLDWFIRVRVKKFQFGQSFTILFFLGAVPEDVAQWRTSPHFIGSHGEFVNSDPEHCANCKENANMITEGFIDLDNSLERLGHGNNTEQEIEKYIQDEIHWRIQKIDGTTVPAAEAEVLEVAVMTWDVTDGDVEVLPVHRDITSGKAGGRVPGHKPYTL